MVFAASDYLEWLDIVFADERDAIREARTAASDLRKSVEMDVNGLSDRHVVMSPSPSQAEAMARALDREPEIHMSPEAEVETPQLVVQPPTVASSPPVDRPVLIASATRPVVSKVDWIEKVEEERPLIGVTVTAKGAYYHVIGDATGNDTSRDVQRRLQILHILQSDEIGALADYIEHHPQNVELLPEGRGARRYDVRGLTPELSEALKRYYANPLLLNILEQRDAHQEAVLPARDPDPVRPDKQELPLLVISEPSHWQTMREAEPIASSAAKDDSGHVSPPSSGKDVATVVAATPANSEPFDIRVFRRQARARDFELTRDTDGAVSLHCLRKAGVPDDRLAAVQADLLISAEAEVHIGEAVREIERHLRISPNDFTISERFSLNETAPKALRELWAFHQEAELFREKLEAAFARAYHQEEIDQTDSRESRPDSDEGRQGHEVAKSTELSNRGGNILTGEAAKAAAIAAAQRQR
ncbi:hypothetical protein [Sphingobium nicotianae]|uniref:Uncharacterized protein n=1 Tax=Sphingobium nicotianae TaxID=2782607 RepID=A0A9X1DCA1_9SPHN|nr:hypothetical protein [Sphingobium nicotianae]MBT2187465.1 hypothetical protein [Sphingobium nicotianae]